MSGLVSPFTEAYKRMGLQMQRCQLSMILLVRVMHLGQRTAVQQQDGGVVVAMQLAAPSRCCHALSHRAPDRMMLSSALPA